MISKKVRKKEIFCLFCLCLGGVGSACATAKVTLLSSPTKAEVYVAALGDRKAKLLGETPIKMSASQISKEYGGAGPVYLEFKKDGYSTSKTIITDIGAVDLTINMELLPSSGLEDLIRLNSIVDTIFESQRLAKVGREDDALVRLKALEKEAPQLAATYELEGGIYYLQKKYKDALDAYTLASNFNPKNPQVVRMKNFLEVSLGVRKKEILEPGPEDKIKAQSAGEGGTTATSTTSGATPPATTMAPAASPKKGGG